MLMTKGAPITKLGKVAAEKHQQEGVLHTTVEGTAYSVSYV